ncbi:MAG TPA: ribonuclease P protein component [Jatrophihabitans sp.]|nr:ribonuclease P protein component [Jatrophihabitans sp.]
MLPAQHRMRRSSDFTSVVRAGVRRPGGPVIVHQRLDLGFPAARVGFVVGKAVGNSVVRHQVARRLRAQVAQRLHALPPGSGTVVRALPPAATATSDELGAGLDRALAALAKPGRA